jgi:thiol-disulfide isomerase/thioredoxin
MMQRPSNPNTMAMTGMAPIQPKMGGTPIQRIRSAVSSAFSWTNIIIFIILLIFIFVGYTAYKQYAANSANFNANREHSTTTTNTQGANNTATLMLFYVDWCPHCKTAKPEWDALKTEYETKTVNGYTIVFEEHNCTVEGPEVEQLMDKYKIEGYPTIKLIKDNQVIEYDAKPTKSTMEQFLNTVL